MTVTGRCSRTGETVKLWPVDLVWAENGRILASQFGEEIAELTI